MSKEGETQSRSIKLIQIIEDTIQILVDDYDLMQDDQYEEPNEINAEEIIYDVIKVLEDSEDPEVALEMIVPVIGSLQKYMINLAEHANIFLVQLFLHLIQTCLSGIKGEFKLPKSIVKHILEVVIIKLPREQTLLVEQAFLLGALIQHCTQDDLNQMSFICTEFLLPLLQQAQQDDAFEALTGCLTDVSGVFKVEFQQQRDVIETLLEKLYDPTLSEKQSECIFNALGDITLSGGLDQQLLPTLMESIQPLIKKTTLSRASKNSLIQMHTCLFNSLNEQDKDLINGFVPYVKDLIEFVILNIEKDNRLNKTNLKDQLSLLLDIAVLYGKSDYFTDLEERIWNNRTQQYFSMLKKQLESEDDYKPLLYFENVLQRIFKVEFQSL